ncbi:MAG: DUF2313 domain-containing protein [Oscillospiraceae bacterium]|nr:DUF2313 domain-containing protein [Oscillospiraceae bacterium]
MGYAAELRSLLRPTGVYDLSPGSLSGAAVEALGAALDDACAYLERCCREALVMTAEDEGLRRMEALFPFAAPEGTAARRAAIAGFVQVSGDGFTPAALERCLSACGTGCAVREKDAGALEVLFPGVIGEPDGYAEKKRVIESILPCHLRTDYVLMRCTFALTESEELTWNDLASWTFFDWASHV